MVTSENKLVFFLLIFCSDYVYCERERCELRTRIESGWICGKRRVADRGVEYASFRGVPYATQPVGRLRFQELRPATPWNHDYDATEEGPVCPQHDEVYGRLMRPLQGMSEACIYANIHVPIIKTSYDRKRSHQRGFSDSSKFTRSHEKGNQKEERGLPILVYVHGGAFQAGSGDSDLNGPEYLVGRNVIVITFNYRINVFGFLYLNSPEVPGNQALRDQVTLLRWVRRNARAFGGDPDNVTLMGQSAGATCAHLLSLSKATVGLFRRVILSSGTANPGFYTTSPLYSKAVAALFLSELGINSTDPVEIHNQLVTTPLNKILLANSNVQYKTGIISFVPVEETSFPGVTRVVDADPTELIKGGRGNQYPLMVGFNTVECGVFRPRIEYLDYKSRIEANPTMLLSPRIVFQTPPTVSLRLARQAIRKYFKERFTYDEYEISCGETLFEYPAFQLANLRASMEGAPVFLYQFAYESQLNFLQEAYWVKYNGTSHVEDFVRIFKPNAFMENIDVEQLPPKDAEMKDWMTTLVVNFMKCSNPACSAKARPSPWPAVRPETFNYQQIETPGEFRNSGPTPDQWDMIEFNEYIERQSRRAVYEQGTLTDGANATNVFLASVNQLFNLQRPRYPLAVIYRPRVPPKMRFKEIQLVGFD